MGHTVHPVNRMIMFMMIFVSAAAAQRPPLNSPLLDHLVGRWVLQGIIAGKKTTQDVTAEWVANHQYLRLHEVSRERTADGKPQYDAFILRGLQDSEHTHQR